MIRSLGFALALVLIAVQAGAQTLVERAQAEFEKQDYPAAVELMRRAVVESPDDADVHYHLGYYLHYLSYDSVPLSEYGRGWSDEVLVHLRRATELDPTHGDAYYFIGAEYGGRARDALQRGDVAGATEAFRQGRVEGGYPDWMLEYGRNILQSCDTGAILFLGGDAETNPVQYAQIVDGFRTDVTAIPMALMGRPWFVRALKNGIGKAIVPAPVSWSELLIDKMHPYPWRTNTIRVPAPDGSTFEWELSPDLLRGGRPLLSPGRALLADIIKTNAFIRPVYFASGCPPDATDGFDDHLQIHGFVQELLPAPARQPVNVSATLPLLRDANNFEAVPTLIDHDMPRVSRLLQNYRVSFLRLILQASGEEDDRTARDVLAAMRAHVPEEALPMPESLRRSIAGLEARLSEE